MNERVRARLMCARDVAGQSAIHIAARRGATELCTMLVGAKTFPL